MLHELPVLTWDEVWADIALRYPELVGAAYLTWIGSEFKYYVDFCVWIVIRREKRGRKVWTLFTSTVNENENEADEEVIAKLCRERNPLEVLILKDDAAKVQQLADTLFKNPYRANEIVSSLKDGETPASISRRFGVGQRAIDHYTNRIKHAFLSGAT